MEMFILFFSYLFFWQSPANVDAAVMWRKNLPEFKKKVRRTVEKSLEGL
jgi:ubiquitin-protein ligase